jgi:hypothetical protein
MAELRDDTALGNVPDIGLDLIYNKKNKPELADDEQFSDIDVSEVSDNEEVQGNGNEEVEENTKGNFSDDEVSIAEPKKTKYQPQQREERPYMTRRQIEEDRLNKKKTLLYQFDRLEKKGVKLPKLYTMASDLDEMSADYEKIVREKEIDNSILFQRKMLLGLVTGVEYMNNKFDPFSVKLDGWSENVHEEINGYDDIFEELHDKYSGSGSMAPELRLLFSLAGSAFMFHLTNTMFKSSLPGVEQVFKQNPNLMKQFASATMNTMANNGNPQAQSMNTFFSNIMGNAGNGGSAGNAPKMSGPTNMDEILQKLERDNLEVMSTLTESDISDLPDNVSISGLASPRRRKTRGGSRSTLNI